jgi:hypothetical protein
MSANDPLKKIIQRYVEAHKPSPSEMPEMESLLKKHGYDPKDAKRLQAEEMGPEELAHILKTTKPGAMGSLEYTHNLKKIKTARSAMTAEQIAERLFKSANALFDFRGRTLREDFDILQEAYDDATGMVTQGMYADPEVKATKDAIHELDNHIGNVARQMEHLARELKKLPHRGS